MNPEQYQRSGVLLLSDKARRVSGDLFANAGAEFDARMEELAALPPKRNS